MLHLRNSTIIVGLSLAEEDLNLIHSATKLAKKLSSKLVLAHAILPFQAYTFAGEGAFYPLASYENTFRELSEVMTRERFDELKKTLNELGQNEIEFRVIHNDPAIGLIHLADELQASLIMCGYQPDQEKGHFLGMSTANLLMAESKIPVLALPVNHTFTFDHPIGFADDLEEETMKSLKVFCDFAKEIRAPKLFHIHVKNISKKEISNMTETIKSAMILGKIPSNPDFDEDFYLNESRGLITKLLEDRYRAVSDSTTTEMKRQSLIEFGSPTNKLKEISEKIDLELVGFGRHKFFDPQTWSFGKIPYHAMVSLKRGVMVIPGEKGHVA